MEGLEKTPTLEGTIGEDKTPTAKLEIRKNNKVIIQTEIYTHVIRTSPAKIENPLYKLTKEKTRRNENAS